MHELISQYKIILSKKFSIGSVYVIEMLNDMYVVLGFTSEEQEPIYSRVFFFNQEIRKKILKQARSCFFDVRKCFFEKRLDKLDSLDW